MGLFHRILSQCFSHTLSGLCSWMWNSWSPWWASREIQWFMIIGWFFPHERWSEGLQLDLIDHIAQKFRLLLLLLGFRYPVSSIIWPSNNQLDSLASSWCSCFWIAIRAQAWMLNLFHKRKDGSETALCRHYFPKVGEVWIKKVLISELQCSSLHFDLAKRCMASANIVR
jgi:hypothetical protein